MQAWQTCDQLAYGSDWHTVEGLESLSCSSTTGGVLITISVSEVSITAACKLPIDDTESLELHF